MLAKALQLAAQITHPVTAAIFAAVLALMALLALAKGNRKPPQIAWVLSIALFLLGLSPLIASTYLDSRGIYRVRIEVFNTAREPVRNAEITSSAGGELKKTDAGWEFTIPREEKPATGEVIFRAAKKDAFWQGSTTLNLGKDYFPEITIQLKPLPASMFEEWSRTVMVALSKECASGCLATTRQSLQARQAVFPCILTPLTARRSLSWRRRQTKPQPTPEGSRRLSCEALITSFRVTLQKGNAARLQSIGDLDFVRSAKVFDRSKSGRDQSIAMASPR
jgi:hypothetical protein